MPKFIIRRITAFTGQFVIAVAALQLVQQRLHVIADTAPYSVVAGAAAHQIIAVTAVKVFDQGGVNEEDYE